MKKPICVGLAMALSLAAVPAAAEDLTFMLTNRSSFNVTEFYTSPADVREWETNLLDGAYLPSGNEIPVTIGDGRTQCVYDLRFVLEDAEPFEDYGINLCETGGYELSDE